MTKVEANTNTWYGLDQPAGSTGNSLEIRPRTSPFPDFRGWGSGGPKKAPKPDPAAPKPKVVPKPIDTQSALGVAFKKASDAMKAYVEALEAKQQIPKDIADKESKAAAAQIELSVAIANEAALMCRLKHADTLEQAILKVVEAHVGNKKVDAANEVLFRGAAMEVLNKVRTSPAR